MSRWIRHAVPGCWRQLTSQRVASSALGLLAEEGFELQAGDDPSAADLEIREPPSAHLVVQQVAGKASDLGDLVDGVCEPRRPRRQAGGTTHLGTALFIATAGV